MTRRRVCCNADGSDGTDFRGRERKLVSTGTAAEISDDPGADLAVIRGEPAMRRW